jgi:hypothetical protein
MKRILAIAVMSAMCWVAAITSADAHTPSRGTLARAATGAVDPFLTAPIIDPALVPEQPLWNDIARRYWSYLSPVHKCPADIEVRLIDYQPQYAAAWGDACMMWWEAQYLAVMRSQESWWQGQEGCRVTVHEYGHAVYALTHAYVGDEASIMTNEYDIPSLCKDQWPQPPNVHPDPWKVACYPSWVWRSTEKIFRVYDQGHKAKARRLYRKWKRTHRLEAIHIASKKRVCIPDV